MSREDGNIATDTPLMTVAEAAAFLRIKIHTLDVWRSTGRVGIPFHKIGAKIFYKREDLEAYIASCRVEG